MIRIAVIDSGVHASHPHVNGVAGGIGVDVHGCLHEDFVDRLGHGTAVTAAIREKAPRAEILAVKVFDRELQASGRALEAACQWALARNARLLNLSLGTVNPHHQHALACVVDDAMAIGAVIVAAAPEDERRWLPGSLPGVWKVTLDMTLPRDRCQATVDGQAVTIAASGYPRPIPDVPPERNLKGLSFAVANATGLLAALFEKEARQVAPLEILTRAIANGWNG